MNILILNLHVDLLEAILWQYDKAAKLKNLVQDNQNFADVNSEQYWLEWFNNVFNLTTANEFGLKIWSFILDFSTSIETKVDPGGKPIFGFNAYNPTFPTLLNTNLNFENSNFTVTGGQGTLTVSQQRFILRLRYYQLISNGQVPNINTFINYLGLASPDVITGTWWLLDGLDMTITYVFNFYISPNVKQVLIQKDLLPRPAGVGIKYLQTDEFVFGFGDTNQNFENGNFFINLF